MNPKSRTEEIYNWLKGLKTMHKVSYKRMADIIGYSGPGLIKAVDKQTLSLSDIEKIANETGFAESFNELIKTKSNSESGSIEDQIAQRVYELNQKEFEYMKERFNEITEKLNQLLVEKEIELEREKNRNQKLSDS